MQTIHGVYSQDGLLSMHGRDFKRYQRVSIQSIQGLFNLALTHGLTHLWVSKDSGIVPDKRFYSYDEKYYDLSRVNWTRHEEQIKTVTGWKTGGGQQQISVIFTPNTRWATSAKESEPGWAARATPQHHLITVFYLEKALGIPIAGSPSMSGWKLVEWFHPEWVKGQSFSNLKIIPFGKGSEDWTWQADVISCTRRFLHKFDKASAYLAAAENEFYGAGELVRSYEFDGKSCGVWECLITKTTTSDLPFILERKGTWTQWLAGPMIRLLRAKGYEVEIKQGYVFKERHQVFAKWASFVWNKRWSFMQDEKEWKHPQARVYAAEAMKDIAVATIGVTAFGGYGEDEDTDKRRPDIRMQTIARNYELMYHNMVKTLKDDGKLPDMVKTDAFYYESDNPDGRASFPSLVKREGKLGGFKYEGRIEITDEVRAMLQEKGSVNQKLKELNKIGWEK